MVYLSKLRSLTLLVQNKNQTISKLVIVGSELDSGVLKGEYMNQHPHVYWLTGLSDSGKSTMCKKLVEYLRNRGKSVILLDGDEIRAVVGAVKAYTRDERMALALRYSRLCKLLSDQGFDVAIATISLFEEVHSWNRENLPGYCEIFLDVPLEELRRRDTKGIYERYDRKEINNVAGIDLQVDLPKNPDIVLHYAPTLDQQATFDELIRQLRDLNRI